MIYITQLVYIKAGQEKVFEQFEARAIPAIARYNGQMLLRIRPAENSFIEYAMEKPFEVHLVAFDGEKDFQDFMQDKERLEYLHLKEQSVERSILIRGDLLSK